MSETTTSASLGLDHSGLSVLPLEECLRRLRDASVGRVAFVEQGEPVILPVNHAMDGDAVVFRTAAGSKLTAARGDLPVAFEIDCYDLTVREGWSVIVRGTATVVEADDDLARLDRLALNPWADFMPRTDWVRIRGYSISGREVWHHGRQPEVR